MEFNSPLAPPLPPSRPHVVQGVCVNAEVMNLCAAQAILESLEIERPDMFGFLRALPMDDNISHAERMAFARQIIRQDYDNYASVFVSSQDRLPPAPPSGGRTMSQQEAYEISLKIDEEEAAMYQQQAYEVSQQLDEEEAAAEAAISRQLAYDVSKVLDEEEAEERAVFMCCICMVPCPIHGSFMLDCSHRFCSECLQGYIGSKINSNQVTAEQLVCPEIGCSCPILHTTIHACTVDMGDKDMFEKFDNFMTENFLAKEILAGSYFRCPTDTCNYVCQWKPDGTSLPFDCPSCLTSYCLNCSLVSGGIGPGHAPHTCEMQAARNEQLAEEKQKFEAWKALNEQSTKLFEEEITRNGWKSKSCLSIMKWRTMIIIILLPCYLAIFIRCRMSTLQCGHRSNSWV
jgi:hypothetical protein